MKGRAIHYSEEELAWIEAHKLLRRAEAYAMFQARFARPEITQTNYASLCKRKGWMTGRNGRFTQGQEPHNKGKPFCAPGSEKGWFRTGERRGAAADLYKPIGTERISKDGYIERKIHDGLPLQSRWRAVHLIRWEALHGSVPEGHALKCLDGDRTNTAPANWTAVPRALLPRLNGRFGRNYDAAPAEMQPVILATAQLEHTARSLRQARKEKNQKGGQACINPTPP